MRAKILGLGFAYLVFIIACSSSAPPPLITEQEKSLAINSIKAHEGVKDAAISQEGKTLSLVIIVDYRIAINKAKELGDNFVRLTKSFSKDTAPEKEIGPGIYDYMIGVYYPNKKEVVMGAKSSIARSITW